MRKGIARSGQPKRRRPASPRKDAATDTPESYDLLIKAIEQLERDGPDAIATQTVLVDVGSNTITGECWVHPGRSDIQTLYQKAFDAAPAELKGRVLKGYVAHHPIAAWDPNSWFLHTWWSLRARRDDSAKRLLRAIAAGVKAPADLGMSKSRATQMRLRWARASMDRYWRPEIPELKRQLQVYRETKKWALTGDPNLIRQAEECRGDLTKRVKHLTGYTPSRADLDRLPISRLMSKAAAEVYGVPLRYLHDKPRKSVAFF